MVEVGVRELKRDLSGYLRRAAAGEPVRVTMRGKPVVDLTPVRQSAEVDPVEAELSYLASVGKVTRATRRKPDHFEVLDFGIEESLVDMILADRAAEDER
jgi:prevent-host-death family protein